MRYVDIYEDCGTYCKPVACNCLQIGAPVLTRTPIAKRYVMADGSPAAYPAELDAATITVELECGVEQARSIAKAVRLSRLIFAGLSIVTSARQNTLPPVDGIPAIIAGGVNIEERYSGSGIYRVTLPLQIELQSGGGADSCAVPAFKASAISVNGTAEPTDMLGRLTGYQFRKDGRFWRTKPIATASAACTVGYTAALPSGLISTATFGAVLIRIGSSSVTSTELEDTLTVSLDKGVNELALQLTATGGSAVCKPAYYRMTVFRQG